MKCLVVKRSGAGRAFIFIIRVIISVLIMEGSEIFAAPPALEEVILGTGLSPKECRQLHRRQLKIMSRPDNPLHLVISSKRSFFLKSKSGKKQISYCRKKITRENFRCQRKANNLHGLLHCYQKYSLKSKKGQKNRVKIERIKNNYTIRPGKTGRVRACRRAYNHLLKIYSKSKELKKIKNARKLLKHWKSSIARKSFEDRCIRLFRTSDLNCILSTVDKVMIQGCLLRVPGN